MAGKEKWHKGAADSTRKGKHSLGASGQPASPCHASGLPPRVGEGPARPDCGIGGSSGRRKPSGCRCTKTGVTAARLPRQARQPVPSQQRGPSRAHEADARKQQRRAAATAYKLPLSRPALRRSTNDTMPARGGEEVIIDDFKSSGARSRVPSRFRDRQPGERPRACLLYTSPSPRD